jgi:NTE family protein
LIARQLVSDVERLRDRIEIVVVPPLCPLDVSPYDFSHGGELIDRAGETTARWLAKDGLRHQAIPGALRAHDH